MGKIDLSISGRFVAKVLAEMAYEAVVPASIRSQIETYAANRAAKRHIYDDWGVDSEVGLVEEEVYKAYTAYLKPEVKVVGYFDSKTGETVLEIEREAIDDDIHAVPILEKNAITTPPADLEIVCPLPQRLIYRHVQSWQVSWLKGEEDDDQDDGEVGEGHDEWVGQKETASETLIAVANCNGTLDVVLGSPVIPRSTYESYEYRSPMAFTEHDEEEVDDWGFGRWDEERCQLDIAELGEIGLAARGGLDTGIGRTIAYYTAPSTPIEHFVTAPSTPMPDMTMEEGSPSSSVLLTPHESPELSRMDLQLEEFIEHGERRSEEVTVAKELGWGTQEALEVSRGSYDTRTGRVDEEQEGREEEEEEEQNEKEVETKKAKSILVTPKPKSFWSRLFRKTKSKRSISWADQLSSVWQFVETAIICEDEPTQSPTCLSPPASIVDAGVTPPPTSRAYQSLPLITVPDLRPVPSPVQHEHMQVLWRYAPEVEDPKCHWRRVRGRPESATASNVSPEAST